MSETCVYCGIEWTGRHSCKDFVDAHAEVLAELRKLLAGQPNDAAGALARYDATEAGVK